MVGHFVGLYLISFSGQSLQRTEDGVMGSNSDQYVLVWIYLTFHDSAVKLCQVFDKWKMALMREKKQTKKTNMATNVIFWPVKWTTQIKMHKKE